MNDGPNQRCQEPRSSIEREIVILVPDTFSFPDYAREGGEKKGLQKGELIGQIATLQSILEMSTPNREELLTFDLAQLTELANQFQEQLRSRGNLFASGKTLPL